MKRKLIKQGTGEGLVVYLPREWIKERKLISGDLIEIIDINGGLLINADDESKQLIPKKEINVECKVENYNINRIILKNYYYLGYSKFIIHYHNDNVKQMVEDICEVSLFGFEVSSEDKKTKTITLIPFANIEERKVEKILSKFFFVLEESLKELYEYYKSNNDKSKKRILLNSKRIDKFESVIRRMIFSKQAEYYEHNLNYWNIITYSNLVDRSIRNMVSNCESISIDKLNFLEDLSKNFELLHRRIYLKKELLTYEEYSIKLLEIQKECISLLNSSTEDNLATHFIKEISDQLYFLGAPIISLISFENSSTTKDI
jgi:hypothetical protein